MRIAFSIAEARSVCSALRSSQRALTLGLVPTMGALHAGHLSLVEAARSRCDIVVASIFVNPTQFGPQEDLARYPRSLEADCTLLQAGGVDLVFAPSATDMYPTGGLATFVDPGPLGDRLDGHSRPGHFRGVCTVVSKLFAILDPDVAFFGQKDAAQVAVLRAMSRDLDLRVRIEVGPIVRDSDGLALSSRNRYLTPEQRHTALALPRALHCAAHLLKGGEQHAAPLVQAMREQLEQPGIRVDYAEIVHADTLLPVDTIGDRSLFAVAAWVGETRLIDNLLASSVNRSDAP